MALDPARPGGSRRGLAARRGGARQDWSRYWRSGNQPIEAMHAHFSGHVYHRHSHDGYSFGVTEDGAQAFGCRNAQHVSAAGMIMTFNPDDPHDGHAVTENGFTYRMVHVGPDLLAAVMSDVARDRHPAGLPLFPVPVADDRLLAARLRRLHGAVSGQAGPLEVYERIAGVVPARVDRHGWAARGAAPKVRVPRRGRMPRGRRPGRPGRDDPGRPTGYASSCTPSTPTRSPPTTWPRPPGAAGSPPTAPSGPPSAFRPATTSGSCGCARHARCWPRAPRQPMRRPQRGLPTRRI